MSPEMPRKVTKTRQKRLESTKELQKVTQMCSKASEDHRKTDQNSNGKQQKRDQKATERLKKRPKHATENVAERSHRARYTGSGGRRMLPASSEF